MGEAERRDRFASVVLKLPIDKEFQYSIPPRLSGKIAPGKRVRVPFRNRVTSGFCVGLSSTLQTRQVKPILDIVDPEPMVGEKMLNLTRWLSRYYCCSWGEALEAAVPAPVRKGIKGRGVLYAVLASRRMRSAKPRRPWSPNGRSGQGSCASSWKRVRPWDFTRSSGLCTLPLPPCEA